VAAYNVPGTLYLREIQHSTIT